MSRKIFEDADKSIYLFPSAADCPTGLSVADLERDRVVSWIIHRMHKQRGQFGMKEDGCAKHKLDEAVDCVRNQSGLEVKWENQPNTLVENHPYLIGYAFLIGFAVTFAVSHLIVFAISFLFLFFISDFMTRDVHRVVPFVPKALLFSVLYILVILVIILITSKIIPMMLKKFSRAVDTASGPGCTRTQSGRPKMEPLGVCRSRCTERLDSKGEQRYFTIHGQQFDPAL